MGKLLQFVSEFTITQGQDAGQQITIYPWERRFLNALDKTTKDVALTMGRGNGKTLIVAGVGSAALVGPWMQPRAETVIVASSLDQSRIAFDHIKAFVRERGYNLEDRKRWRFWDTSQHCRIEDKRSGAAVRCIGAVPKRMHGLAPRLVLADEPAQWDRQKRDAARAALKTGLGKIPGSRLVALGTRSSDTEHWFSKMLAGIGAELVVQYAAGKNDPLWQRRTWYKANPSLRYMPHLLAEIEEEAEQARRDPSLLASFKALRLNLGTSDTLQNTLLDAGVWASIEVEAPACAGPCIWGVDLSDGAAFSAVTAYYPETGGLRTVAAFPHTPDLEARGERDAVGELYTKMHQRGEIILAGPRVVSVPGLLQEALDRFGEPDAIAGDRFRQNELIQALEAAKIEPCHVSWRGMGFKDGAEDVRLFRRMCLDGYVQPEISLLLRSCMAEACTIADPAGNEKLSKSSEGGRRQKARDDAAAAGVLAVAEGARLAGIYEEEEESTDSPLVAVARSEISQADSGQN